MALKSNALITVDDFIASIRKTRSDYQVSYFKIYNSSVDASACTVTKSGNTLTLVVTGGVNAGSYSFDLTNALYDTLAELTASITALSKGFVVNRLGHSISNSTDLNDISAVNCLLMINEITLSGFDGFYIEDLINQSSNFIQEAYLCRNLILQSYTDYYDGIDDVYLRIDNYPITAVASVKMWEYQAQQEVYTYSPNIEYEVFMDRGMIYKSSGWNGTIKQWKIAYTAGYTLSNMPSDIKLACMKLSRMLNSQLNSDGIKSESMGDYSVTYDKNNPVIFNGIALPNDIITLLSPYRKWDRR